MYLLIKLIEPMKNTFRITLSSLLLGFLLTACANKKAEQPKEEPKPVPKEDMQSNIPPKDEKAPECYTYLNKRDTVYLQISEVYNMITGLLLYKYYGKDQKLGT